METDRQKIFPKQVRGMRELCFYFPVCRRTSSARDYSILPTKTRNSKQSEQMAQMIDVCMVPLQALAKIHKLGSGYTYPIRPRGR